jgi:hypothetical protein
VHNTRKSDQVNDIRHPPFPARNKLGQVLGLLGLLANFGGFLRKNQILALPAIRP